MKILIIDIETTPHNAHVWGLYQQNVGLPQLIKPGDVLCFAAKWYGERTMHFHSKRDGVKKMLRAAAKLLDEADVVVGYNSKRFDIPWLQGQFLEHGINQPSPFKQVDLLTTAKTQFRLASNKLDYVARVLKLPRKVDTGGHQLWIDCMNGNETAWRKMEAYNRHDVRLTEMVYDAFKGWIKSHPNHGLYTSKGAAVCVNCGSSRLTNGSIHYTSMNKYRRLKCLDCGKWLRGQTTLLTKQERMKMLREAV